MKRIKESSHKTIQRNNIPWTKGNVRSVIGEQMIGSDEIQFAVPLLKHVDARKTSS